MKIALLIPLVIQVILSQEVHQSEQIIVSETPFSRVMVDDPVYE